MWGLFTPACYRRYFHSFDFFDVDCFRQLLSKSLGYAIVAGALIVKLPQILKLLSSGRADSIAPSMFILENIGYSISWAYNHRMGYPFSTYGESVFLLLQGYVLVFLVFYYNKQLTATFWTYTALYAAFAVSLFTVASPGVLAALQSLSIPLFAASRLPQIWSNYKEQSTGQLAFLTTFLNAAGSAARVFTTVQEVPDPIMLTGVGISTALNGIILAQMLWYWNNTTKATPKPGAKGGKTVKAMKKVD